MDLITYLEALLLGVVEGLTEFIPVSSTGHLILLIDLLGFAGPPGKVFEIVIQLGAISAVCWLFRVRLLRAVLHAPRDAQARRFLLNIIVAFLPSMILGALLHGFIKSILFSPYVVSVALIAGGVAIMIIERRLASPSLRATGGSAAMQSHGRNSWIASSPAAPRNDGIADVEDFSWKLALKIGLCQTLAMIPGVSRSGATIMGALLLGASRKAATEFSFFLAIPTMLGATVYDLYKNWSLLTVDGWGVIAVGFISAMLAGGLVVGRLIRFVERHGFFPFAVYRILLGSAMLVLLLLR